jgi:hypothetical protein
MTTPVYKSHPDEIDALMGKTAYGNADTSRADIVTRIREYRDCYGNREFAELLSQACQYTREDMEREHHEGFPSEREWARGIDCD